MVPVGMDRINITALEIPEGVASKYDIYHHPRRGTFHD
jgi:hypothetical protein